ncbi:MAG TPA: hypothetical protein VNW97_12820 [Candidatus Saccharimonadales bacterium]|nr:hypothetical protein [Candidatus Saccharimonadales bacterium]
MNRMINNLMGILRFKSVLRHERIRIERGSRLHVGFGFSLKSFLFTVRDYSGAHFAVIDFMLSFVSALKHSKYSGLIYSAASGNAPFLYIHVHVPRFPANDGFVNFDLPGKLLEESASLHPKSDSVHEEPSGLLSDSQSPMNLIRANPIFASRNHPDRGQPLI